MDTGFESRNLGPIVLDGSMNSALMNTQVTYNDAPLPVRLEIDHPGSLSEMIVNHVDKVLDSLGYVDGLGRDTITAGLSRDETAPAQLLRAWRRDHPGVDLSDDDFVRQLKPAHLTITPDGGRANRDRVVLSYRLTDRAPDGEITVRFLEPTGPELAPAPHGGFH
jgi:hypothetical protein